MNKKIKLSLMTSTLFVSLVPVATAVSCGDEFKRDYSQFDITLVSTPGWVNDKSFAQSAWDALKEIKPEATELKNVYAPASTYFDSIAQVYEQLNETDGTNIVITPGGYHVQAIEEFFNDFPDSKLKFILLDAEVKGNDNVASVLFKAEQAAFLAGEFVSDYLVKYDKTPSTGHVIGMFGGDNIKSITDVMIGFVSGIAHHNASVTDQADKVYVAKFIDNKGTPDSSDDELDINAYTNAKFASYPNNPDGPGRSKTRYLIQRCSSDVILPIAGIITEDVIREIRELKMSDKVKIVGIDADQAKYYTNDSSFFITSIIKDIKKATIYEYLRITGKEGIPNAYASSIKGLGETTIGDLENGLVSTAMPASTGNHVVDADIQSIYNASINDNYIDAFAPSKFIDWGDVLSYINDQDNDNLNPYIP